MADTTTVHTSENSPEHVAWKLFLEVANAEGKDVWAGAGKATKPDRQYILDTYAECIMAVRVPANRQSNRR